MKCTYNMPQYVVWSWSPRIATTKDRDRNSIFAIQLIDFLPCVSQVPLFENTEIGFTKLLALSIKPVLFLKNEYIVRKGDIGSEVGLELGLVCESVRESTSLSPRLLILAESVLTHFRGVQSSTIPCNASVSCVLGKYDLIISYIRTYTRRCSLSIVAQLRWSLRMAMLYLPPWQKESSLGRSV